MTVRRDEVGDSSVRDRERQEYVRALEEVVRENLSKVQRMMADASLDALVLARSDNVRYLTGYGPYDSFSLSMEHGAVVPRDGEPTFLAAPRLAPDIRDRHWLSDVERFDVRGDPAERVADVLDDRGLTGGRVGLDPHTEYRFATRLDEHLSGTELTDAGDLLWRARATKSPKELAIIDEGLEIAELGIEAGIEAVEVGVRECEVSGTIMDAIISAGGAGAYALPAIVSSGVRWSRCQEYPSRKRIRRGEFVQLDEGPMWKGYYSELARMMFVGTPTDEQRDMYQATYEAHRAAIDAMAPGVTGAEVYEAAEAVFDAYGYAEWLTDGNIGHGIGVVTHEPPYVGPAGADGETVTLEPDMVVMMEPGFFRPGVVGVRFEDMVRVTESGHEVLSRTDHPHHDKFT
ncbi:M24 family metallopeptidase [Haladaptatus sp. NG-WS-4]